MSRTMTTIRAIWRKVLLSTLAIFAALIVVSSATASPPTESHYYLPDAAASKIVSVARTGEVEAEATVLTEAVAIKETGPKATVAKFGEVYAFSPNFIAIRREVPTMLTFWNLQPDDEHDIMLTAPDFTVLMHVTLAPLSKTSFVFTFHKDGIFNFYCTIHQPEMNGQILVLPPADAKRPLALSSAGPLDHADRRPQPLDSAALPEYRDHLVDAGADRAAGQRHAHWLRELPELEVASRQH